MALTSQENSPMAILKQHPGRVAAVVRSFEGETLFEVNADSVFPAASTIKVPLLIRALQRVQAGELHLEQRIQLRASDRVTGSGILRDLEEGLALTLRDVLTLMIIVSDNTATNMVIDQLGIGDVNAFLERHGWTSTHLVGRLQVPTDPALPSSNPTRRNHTSADDMVDMLRRLVTGELLSAEWTDVAINILSRQHYTDLLGRHLPRDEQGEMVYRLASKSGALMGVRHDVGVVWTPRPLVIAILSEGGLDRRYHPDNHEVQLLARLADSLIQMYGGVTE